MVVFRKGRKVAIKTDESVIEAAEPMEYFLHDSDAFQDLKCQRLVARLGFDGYGRWWLLCELLAGARGHAIPVKTDEDRLILSRQLGFGSWVCGDDEAVARAGEFIAELRDIGLVELGDDGCIYSRRLHENAAQLAKKRANGRKGGRPGKDAAAKPQRTQRK